MLEAEGAAVHHRLKLGRVDGTAYERGKRVPHTSQASSSNCSAKNPISTPELSERAAAPG